MSAQTFGRFGVMLFLVMLTSGCSMIGLGGSEPGGDPRGECGLDRGACMYEGAYERGEQTYAELEARRLNQAELARLRRSSR